MAANADTTIFEMTRHYDRPLATVWKAWSEAAALQQWWGPKGCSIEVKRFEFQPGGFFHYAMRFPGAEPMWGRFNYRRIEPLTSLVWLNSFANEHGGIARAPFSDDCPMEIENTVSFSADASGRTTVWLRARPFGEVAAERRYFEELQPSLNEGYGGTFDQLGDFLLRA
jgi:uncharacterized protein YndB with AHSA1/START domain